MARHQPGRVGERRLRLDRDRRAGMQLACGRLVGTRQAARATSRAVMTAQAPGAAGCRPRARPRSAGRSRRAGARPRAGRRPGRSAPGRSASRRAPRSSLRPPERDVTGDVERGDDPTAFSPVSSVTIRCETSCRPISRPAATSVADAGTVTAARGSCGDSPAAMLTRSRSDTKPHGPRAGSPTTMPWMRARTIVRAISVSGASGATATMSAAIASLTGVLAGPVRPVAAAAAMRSAAVDMAAVCAGRVAPVSAASRRRRRKNP